jgi:hypothetical protein
MTRRCLDILRMALLSAVLACPLAAAALGLSPAGGDGDENRTLAQTPPPGLLVEDPAAYAAALRAAYADRFPLRQTLIRTGNRLRLAVFGESPVPGVVVGRDGWLFYSLENTLDEYLNLMNLPESLQADMERILIERRDRLAARGIAFLVVVAPEKHSIYPEELPGFIHPLRPRSRLDILAERLTAAGVEVADLRPALLQAKAVRRAYWKTDTHWNDWGAFSAAARIVDVLRRRFPAMTPLDAADYRVEEVEVPGGDLARLLLMPDILRETDIRMVPRDPQPPGVAARFGAVRPYPDPANHPERAMVTAETGDTRLPKALFFRDSFSTAMIPFLAGHFQSATFIWNHAYHPGVVAAEKPDVVVLEVVERYQYAFCLENPPEPTER